MVNKGKRVKIPTGDFIECLAMAGIKTINMALSDCAYLLEAILRGCINEGNEQFVEDFLLKNYEYKLTEIREYIEYLKKTSKNNSL